ncbi:MAG: hypothetical protein ABJA37_01965 [Ferruginibacter sp.]
MTTIELTRKIFTRLGKVKLLIVVLGLLVGALLFIYAKNKPVTYTSRASVFPLTASNDNSGASSLLSSLTGLSDAPKSFSQEASINIVELATSRNTRDAVAMERLPQMGNKRIATLLIESANKYKPPFTKDIKLPLNDTLLEAVGGTMLKAAITAKINKNGILELTFSNSEYNLITPVSNVLIDKISQFYKDLKVKKARFDYNFTVNKMDSLQDVLNTYDRRAIHMANTTLFTPTEKIEYTIPKENLISDKERVLSQRNGAANNREEALWRLQKVTPIIETLDKPDPPFDQNSSSPVLYSFIGFLAGCILGALLFVADILYKYINAEINDAIFGDKEVVTKTITATAETSTTL